METVAPTPQKVARRTKRHYHGPRLSRFLPHFFVGVLLLEVAAIVIGAN